MGSREAPPIGRIGERVEGVVVVVRIGKEEIERSQLVFELSCLEHFHIPAYLRSMVPAWGRLARASLHLHLHHLHSFSILSVSTHPQGLLSDKHGDLRLTRFKLFTMTGPSNAPQSC